MNEAASGKMNASAWRELATPESGEDMKRRTGTGVLDWTECPVRPEEANDTLGREKTSELDGNPRNPVAFFVLKRRMCGRYGKCENISRIGSLCEE